MAKDEIVIMYGSQTGQAETIAETIHEAAEEQEIKSTLFCLRKADECFKIVSDGNVPVVFVCSTTGDGELPGTARKFVRMIQRRTLDGKHLAKLRYALLGLGDSNYSTFCGGPKTLERSLKKLGAKSFYASGFADDGTDLEMVVEPWIEGFWPALKSHIQARQMEEPNTLANGNHEQETELSNKIENVQISASSDNISELTELKSNINFDKDINNAAENENSSETETGMEIAELKMNIKSPLSDLSTITEGTLAPAMQQYLSYKTIENGNSSFEPPAFPCIPYPLAADDNFHSVGIKSIKKMTSDEAVKTALCVTLDIGNNVLYEPGDSFGIVVPNPKVEVDWLIKRLKVDDIGDKTIEFGISPETKKKNAKVPNFIPKICTVRYILENCLETRSVPKRTFLRSLLDFTTSETDRNILMQLCRKETMADYIKYVREPNLNIIDILASLPSCQPPFETLVEHLPRLKARLYSAASCLHAHPDELRFVFNVINFELNSARMYERKGLCTGYLESLTNSVDNFVTISLPKLTTFKTKNESFRLPMLWDPIVMIGPGTGVAPFIGFLERLRHRRKETGKSSETWLFYGCRHKECDFLFEHELKSFLEDGTLSHLVVSFSRDQPPEGETKEPKYVQDNLELYSNEMLDLLWRRDGTFFVCGDAKNMAKDVRETVVEILAKEMSLEHANENLRRLVKEGRYKEDVWT